ncbi:MAG: hypothetical protein HY903_12065 [Deltaproteobacteria bacterium]|nr:hypothetical protein [Deltaproteobacteria bacterium]
MRSHVRVALCLTLLGGGCRYQPYALAMSPACDANDGLGPCGVGETCFLAPEQAMCKCGETRTFGGPACETPRTCLADQICNAPPTAAISGAPDLLLAADNAVLIDGGDSDDLDGDPLTYAWTLSGDCVATPPAVTDAAQLALTTAGPATSCSVSLTVSDGHGTDTVTASIGIISVGAHVRQAASGVSCLSLTPELATAGGNGLKDTPWCTIADGLSAARDFGLTRVSVYQTAPGTAYVEDQLQIGAGIEVVGGLADTGAENWTEAADARSAIESQSVHGIVFLPGNGAVLRRVVVYRGNACTSDCSLVLGDDASFTIDASRLGADGQGAKLTSAPGLKAWTLGARGALSTLTLTNSEIFLPGVARAAVGVALEGLRGASSTLSGITITGLAVDASVAVGLRLRWSRDVILGAGPRGPSSITVEAADNAPSKSEVFGILDGNCLDLTIDSCLQGSVCDGSTRVSVGGTRVIVGNFVDTAVGIAFFDSSDSRVTSVAGGQPVTIGASGTRRSTGVWTAKSDGTQIVSGVDRGITISAYQGSTLFAAANAVGIMVGLQDESVSPPTPVVDVPTYTLVIRGTNVSVQANASPVAPGALVGVLVVGAEQAQVDGNQIVLNTGYAGASGVPDTLAGIWSLATTGLGVSGNSISAFTGTGASATTAMADYIDGDPHAAAPPFWGSAALEVTANKLQGAFTQPAGAASLAACTLLLGTNGALVAENTYGCLLSLAGATDLSELHQVWLLDTATTSIADNLFGPTPANAHVASTSLSKGRNTAIRDGRYSKDIAAPALALASADLEIRGNLIYAFGSPTFSEMVGIHLDHAPLSAPAAADIVRVVDNAVLTGPALGGSPPWTSIGVKLENGAVSLVHNTIHGGRCANDFGNSICVPPNHTTGIAIVRDPSSTPAVLLANNLILTGEGEATKYALVDDNAVLSVDPPVLSVAVRLTNAFVLDTNGAGSVCGYGVRSGSIIDCVTDTVCILTGWCPVALVTAPLCADGVHLDPTSAGVTDLIGTGDPAESAAADIDGEPRPGQNGTLDIGADEVTTTTCPVPAF